jgi:hypothetical protein
MARSPMVDFCYTVALTAVTKRVVWDSLFVFQLRAGEKTPRYAT